MLDSFWLAEDQATVFKIFYIKFSMFDFNALCNIAQSRYSIKLTT